MVFQVLRDVLAAVQAFLDLGVGDVARHDDGAVQGEARGDGILRQLCQHLLHRAVQVHADAAAFACLAHAFGNELRGTVVELFNPDAVLVDFALDVAVSGAADAQAYGT